MGLWDTAPSFNNPPNFNDLASVQKYLKENINKIARSLQDIDFIINGTISFDNIKANGITAKNIKAGSVTAEKIQVDELSAISANLGHITAGLVESVRVLSSYFGTRDGVFPLCEIDSATNRIRSAFSDTDYISMEPAFGGSPTLYLTTGLNDTSISSDPTSVYFQTVNDLSIKSNVGDIIISTDFGSMLFDNFYKIFDQSTSESLQQKLDSLEARIAALEP